MATLTQEYVSFGGEWVPVPGGGGGAAAPVPVNSPNHLDMNTDITSMNGWSCFNVGTPIGTPLIGYDATNGLYYTVYPDPTIRTQCRYESSVSPTSPYAGTISVQVEVVVCLIVSANPVNGATGPVGVTLRVGETGFNATPVIEEKKDVPQDPAGTDGTWTTLLYTPFLMSTLAGANARTEVEVNLGSGGGDPTNLGSFRIVSIRWLDEATGALIATF